MLPAASRSASAEPFAGACGPPLPNLSRSTRLASTAERPLVAVVGGGTLLAREIRDLLAEVKPSPRVQLISAAADGSTILAAEDDEAVVMIPLNKESLEG